MRAKKYLALFLFYVSTALGQELQEDVEVDLVNVDITVQDSDGNAVEDLRPEELIVKDGGILREVTHFSRSIEQTNLPLLVTFFVDVSGSMGLYDTEETRNEIALRTAEAILDELQPNDKMMAAAFNDRLLYLTGFTPNKSLMKNVLASFKPIPNEQSADSAAKQALQNPVNFMSENSAACLPDYGLGKLLAPRYTRYESTSIYDSMLELLEVIRTERGRKVVFVLSDFRDNDSDHWLHDALKAYNKENIKLFGFVTRIITGPDRFFGDYPWLGKPGGLISTTLGDKIYEMRVEKEWNVNFKETGGHSFFISNSEQLTSALVELRQILQAQYSIAFRPADQRKNGTWRDIKIQCLRKGVRLRYRNQYYVQ
jgi:VWFA-related protein